MSNRKNIDEVKKTPIEQRFVVSTYIEAETYMRFLDWAKRNKHSKSAALRVILEKIFEEK